MEKYLDEKYPQDLLLPCDLRKKAINYQVIVLIFMYLFIFLKYYS